MKVLFIKLKHIGDALIMTSAITSLKKKYPQVEVSVLVRRGTETILAGCGLIDHLYVMAEPEREQRTWKGFMLDVKTFVELNQQEYDHVFNLGRNQRGAVLCLFLSATQTWNMLLGSLVSVKKIFFQDGQEGLMKKNNDFLLNYNDYCMKHSCEADHQFLEAAYGEDFEASPFCFERDKAKVWKNKDWKKGENILVHPATRWDCKKWPQDRWVSLIDQIQALGLQVILSIGPDEDEKLLAKAIQKQVKLPLLSTEGKASWSELAYILYHSRAFIGVDTAAMHLAAACQCPSVALFGESEARAWKPFQVEHRLLQKKNRYLDEPGLMEWIKVEMVVEALKDLIKVENK
jgi:heptosyltransferase-3